jgi:hypothetical protein
MFSLDVFDSCKGFIDCALGLLMHNIPVFVLIVFLIIAWRYEIVGAVVFFIAGALYILMILMNSINSGFQWFYLSWFLFIAGPAFLIGALFLIGWFKKRGK